MCDGAGSNDYKIFLLHQSIDLDEPYRMVRVAQIVTRRKYFILKLRVYVSCTHTRELDGDAGVAGRRASTGHGPLALIHAPSHAPEGLVR